MSKNNIVWNREQRSFPKLVSTLADHLTPSINLTSSILTNAGWFLLSSYLEVTPELIPTSFRINLLIYSLHQATSI